MTRCVAQTPSAATTQCLSYQCPGHAQTIDRATHLGRLAAFYPACRECQHRDDTGTLSAVQVSQLIEVRRSRQRAALWGPEGIAGVCLNEVDASVARRFATALGIHVLRATTPAAIVRSTNRQSSDGPLVALGSVQRSVTASLVAAASEGLRLAGCNVAELGCVTSACLVRAADQLDADGALMVGNPSGQPHTVALTVWGRGGRPWSAPSTTSGGALEVIRQLFDNGVDRPGRRYGALQREVAEQSYLKRLRPYFHALRPLRFVLDTASSATGRYLRQLLHGSGCQLLTLCKSFDSADGDRTGGGTTQPVADTGPYLGRRVALLGDQVRAARAHFGLWIDGDGEITHLVDERGRFVASERLLTALVRYLIEQHPGARVVVECGAPPSLTDDLARLGAAAVPSGGTREEVFAAMVETQALLGGGASGRFWFLADSPVADALLTLSLLLTILSRSDFPLSAVLDSAACGS